ncbi:ArsR/SmtB family transcription factor [Kitasatospora sp. NPDC057015]|uniref:ArsR/SmtB family transcription factor n=1 Tax=Kitasatospora sp. NPDC057015 TaxID=3346001 RepID=UPI0036405FA9
MKSTPHPSRDRIRLDHVLAALGNPMRLTIVRILSDGAERPCGSILDGVSKSTLTHHWKVLRESGVIRQQPSGRELLLTLRREDLDARYPGLLDALLAGIGSDARAEAGGAPGPGGPGDEAGHEAGYEAGRP